MTTSLTSGLPRRETWTHLPFDPLFESKSAFVTSIRLRSVVDHTPTTALAASAPDTLCGSS